MTDDSETTTDESNGGQNHHAEAHIPEANVISLVGRTDEIGRHTATGVTA